MERQVGTQVRERIPPARVSHGTGFWLVAYAFTVVMAFSALPTPLYVIYAQRDGFSALVTTLVFAVYVVGVVVSLLLAGHVSDWYGRRSVLLPAIVISVVSGLVFIGWRDLPALIVARFLSGIAVGMVTTAATAHLVELHRGSRPDASASRPNRVAVAANLGGIGLGPLMAGLLAQFAPQPLLVPYLVAETLLVLAVVALIATPETMIREPVTIRYRPQRIAVPRGARGRFALAALAGFAVFGVFGLFTSLAPGFLAVTLGNASHALAGAVAFSVFASAAVAQIALGALDLRRTLGTGLALLVSGLTVLASSLWVALPSIFVLGGIIAGAGAGLVFKGVLAIAIDLAPAGSRAEVLAAIFVASYTGLAVPVVALGVIGQVVSTQVELAGFAFVTIAVLVPTLTRLLGATVPPHLGHEGGA